MEATIELGRRAGFEIEAITDVSWQRSLEMMRAGDLDLLHSVSWREERTEFLDYIGTYDQNLMALVVQKGTELAAYDTLDAFVEDGKTFGLGRGVALSPEFDNRFKEDEIFASHFQPMMSQTRRQESDQFAGVFTRIAEGTVTGFILEAQGLHQVLSNSGDWGIDDTTLQGIDVLYPKVFDQDETFLTASKNLSPEIRTALRREYDGMREDGTFLEIWQKWYPGSPAPRPNVE